MCVCCSIVPGGKVTSTQQIEEVLEQFRKKMWVIECTTSKEKAKKAQGATGLGAATGANASTFKSMQHATISLSSSR